MITYNFDEDLTTENRLKPAMEITTQEEADNFFEQYVKYLTKMKPEGFNEKLIPDVARTNLGYDAGFYNNETRERVERLFQCEHPIFGKISKKGIQMGQDIMRMKYSLKSEPDIEYKN